MNTNHLPPQVNDIILDLDRSFYFKKEVHQNAIELDIQDKKALGSIHIVNLAQEILCISLRLKALCNFDITTKFISPNYITLMYCSKGEFYGVFSNLRGRYRFEEFQTGIALSENVIKGQYLFKENQTYDITLIQIPLQVKGDEFKSRIHKSLSKVFLPKIKDGYFFYAGSYNACVAEKIRKLNELREHNLVSYLSRDSLIKDILSLEIQQYYNDMKHEYPDSHLTQRELETIQNLAAFIRTNFEKSINIKHLCLQGCISPSKLQEGFKLLFKNTVTNYTRSIRLQKAEELLRTTDMNVSEVVYSIGITSRSYFSKIFQNEYGISPSEYRKRMENEVLNA